MSSVLFTLSLTYICELFLCMARTGRRVFRVGPDTEYQRVFKVFYAIVWSTLILTILLYLSASMALFSFSINDPRDISRIGIVSFYYMPTIFMVLLYTLLYYQLEMLMTMSRISSGQVFRTRLQDRKLGKVLKIVTFTIVGIFMALQLLMIALTLIAQLSLEVFFT